MRFAPSCFSRTILLLLLLLLLATAQDENAPPVDDCTAACAQAVSAAVAPLQSETTARTAQLTTVQQTLQTSQDRVRQLEQEAEELMADKAVAQKEVAQFRQSLEKAREEAVKFHEQADENMRAVIDVKTQLAAATSQVSELQGELGRAQEQIAELESISFVKQLQKELGTLWSGGKSSWEVVQAKLFSGRKKEGNEDL